MPRDIQNTGGFWLRLDNAAKIYPAVKDRELTSVFRISAQLKKRIKASPFLEAVRALEDRFPYYKVKLRAGVFWYYLEPADLPITVIPDMATPCRAFGKDDLMFRILARGNTISVEFSHILTDGTGAFEFLRTLLLVYFELCGQAVPSGSSCCSPGEKPHGEEYEDAYKRYFKKIDSRPPKTSKAFHLPFRLKKAPRFNILTAVMPVKRVIVKAKEHGISLTEYLVAVYLFALQRICEQRSRPRNRSASKMMRIEVPVNLRRMFPSRTMRNFSLYVIPGIDPRLGHYSFEEIVKIVYHQMRLETDKKIIRKMISRNVSGEKSPFIRGLPLFVKSLILARLYTLGTKQYSGVVTNLGKINLSEPVNGLIDKFIFVPPPPNEVLKVNCAIAGFGDQLVLTFGNITESMELERQFLTFLTAQDIPIRVLKPVN